MNYIGIISNDLEVDGSQCYSHQPFILDCNGQLIHGRKRWRYQSGEVGWYEHYTKEEAEAVNDFLFKKNVMVGRHKIFGDTEDIIQFHKH